jgi:GRAS domain family
MGSISQEQIVQVESLSEMLSDKCQDGSPASSSSEHSDITLDATLNYISKILLEDDAEEKEALFHEQSSVSAMEKPFYDILRESYPNVVNKSKILEPPQPCRSSIVHNLSHQPDSGNLVTLSTFEFDKGMEEGMKFLPSIDELIANFRPDQISVSLTCEPEENEDKSLTRFRLRCKKKSDMDNLEHLGGRNCKVSMLCSEETARRSALFDEVLLEHDNSMQKFSKLKEVVLRDANNFAENDQGEVHDLKSLLIQCSDAVYANDHQLAKELIEQIRNRSSLDGDGIQRMAFQYANALEARLTGTGGEAWRRTCRKWIPTSEFAKMAKLFITASPFPRVSTCCSNRTILSAAAEASVLHVVDFGIGFGFHWPSLIQAMSNQNANTKKLRITGIDFPRPGFRPAGLVEETGRRLEDYARSFSIPFEYRGITSKNWEAISPDELDIRKDELLIVNCMYCLRLVGDEAVSLDSPRDRVLSLIYQMRPSIFIEGVLNIRSYSPFYLTRFRQSLSLFLSVFEIVDILVARDNKLRQTVETEIFGRDIMNIIACEGSDWTTKPESYKQWHQRNVRAGFEQIPLDAAIVKECREYLSKHHKNKIFFIEEDGNWLLQGWSGRVFDAFSVWKPKTA